MVETVILTRIRLMRFAESSVTGCAGRIVEAAINAAVPTV